MVITLTILFLVASGLAGFFYCGFRVMRDEAEELMEMFSEERSLRIDSQIALEDAKAHVSNLIAGNVQQWASAEVKKVH